LELNTFRVASFSKHATSFFVDVLIANLIRLVPFDVSPHQRLKDLLPTYGAWYVGHLGDPMVGVKECGVLICVVC
jgi:hypothetical protein